MASYEDRVKKVNDALTTFPDFPKPGINFVDIFPIFKTPDIYNECIDLLVEHVRAEHKDVEILVGLDSRGFIFAPLMAQKLGIAFVPVRKAGKLPGETFKASYSLEYGQDQLEAQKGSIKEGQKVIVVDDLLATGGTLNAACSLLREMKADILECLVVIELTAINGKDKIPHKVFSLIGRDD